MASYRVDFYCAARNNTYFYINFYMDLIQLFRAEEHRVVVNNSDLNVAVSWTRQTGCSVTVAQHLLTDSGPD